MKKFKKIITIAYFAILLVGGVLAYFVTSFKDNVLRDGLGRTLYESSGILQFFWFEDHWPGFYWWLFDMNYFWGGIPFIVFVLWKDKTKD